MQKWLADSACSSRLASGIPHPPITKPMLPPPRGTRMPTSLFTTYCSPLISLGAHHRNMFNAVQLSVLDDPLVVPESIYCRVWRMNIITSFIAFHRRYYIVGEFFGCAITTSLRVFCSLLLYPKHLKSLSRSFNPMPNKPVSCNMHSKHNQTP